MIRLKARWTQILLGTTIGLGLLLSSGCGLAALPALPTDPPEYIAPLSTTPAPTPTPTLPPDFWIQSGPEMSVPAGYFAFTPITGWDPSGMPLSLIAQDHQAAQSNQEQTLFFNLNSQPAGDNPTSQACLEMMLSRMAEDITDFKAEPAEAVTLGELQGFRVDISGRVFEDPSIGSLVILHPGERCFSLMGLATAPEAAELWQQSGSLIFERLLLSLRFLDQNLPPLSCETAQDPSYGYSPDNPIRVGNTNLYDGRTREETYLLTLRGPAGQEIFFTRQTAQYNQAGVIVDPYLIEYAQIEAPIILYFDIYNFETPLAPLGFTCEAAFPLIQP